MDGAAGGEPAREQSIGGECDVEPVSSVATGFRAGGTGNTVGPFGELMRPASLRVWIGSEQP